MPIRVLPEPCKGPQESLTILLLIGNINSSSLNQRRLTFKRAGEECGQLKLQLSQHEDINDAIKKNSKTKDIIQEHISYWLGIRKVGKCPEYFVKTLLNISQMGKCPYVEYSTYADVFKSGVKNSFSTCDKKNQYHVICVKPGEMFFSDFMFL